MFGNSLWKTRRSEKDRFVNKTRLSFHYNRNRLAGNVTSAATPRITRELPQLSMPLQRTTPISEPPTAGLGSGCQFMPRNVLAALLSSQDYHVAAIATDNGFTPSTRGSLGSFTSVQPITQYSESLRDRDNWKQRIERRTLAIDAAEQDRKERSEQDMLILDSVKKEMAASIAAAGQPKPDIFPAVSSDEDSVANENAMDVVGQEERTEELIRKRKTPVSAEEHEKIQRILRHSPTHELVVENFNIDMTYSKMNCLNPGQWLNDEVINYYMCMLMERDKKLSAADPTGKRRTSHYFNSFFLDRMLEGSKNIYTYSNIKRWSKKFDVFEKDKIFCPVNLNNTHWTMAVVFIQRREIHYYDSMAGGGMRYLNALLQWVKDESKVKKGVDLPDAEAWKLVSKPCGGVPQQQNGFDCGLFSITCADYISDDLPLVYTQSDMPMLRLKVGAAILRGTIDY